MATLVHNYSSNGDTYTDEYGTQLVLNRLLDGEVVEGFKVVANGSPNMKVRVQPGSGRIPTGTYPSSYGYLISHDTVAGEEVTIAPAAASPRLDYVLAYVDKAVAGSVLPAHVNNTNGVLKFVAVAGTPAGSPVVPTSGQITAVVGSNPYIILGEILVNVGAGSITNPNIADRRVMAKVKMPSGSVPSAAIDWSSLSVASTNTDQANVSAAANTYLTLFTFSNFEAHTGRVKIDCAFNKMYLGTGGTTIFYLFVDGVSAGELCRSSTTNVPVAGEAIFNIAKGTRNLTVRGNNGTSAWQLLQYHSMSCTVVEV